MGEYEASGGEGNRQQQGVVSFQLAQVWAYFSDCTSSKA